MFGNILHESMQELYGEFVGMANPMSAIKSKCSREEVERVVDRKISELIYHSKESVAERFSGDTILVRDIILKYILRGILRYDTSQSGFTIRGLEDDIAYKYKISNGRYVNLFGRADRIDERADGSLQIIDYKSGNKPRLEFNGISTLFHGAPHERISNIFQTLLYSMMLHKDRNVEACPSLYYASQMLSKGYSPHIVNKGGNGEIHKYSDVCDDFEQHLTQIFEELFNKDIAFKQVEDTDACTYCDYKKICRR
jgi:ATP-dependent helicase/DNAse subunit B